MFQQQMPGWVQLFLAEQRHEFAHRRQRDAGCQKRTWVGRASTDAVSRRRGIWDRVAPMVWF